jgi:hypothetical protein
MLEFPWTLNKAYVIYTKNNSMNSRPDDRRILTLVNSTKTSIAKNRKRQRNITTCKKSTFLQEIDQELPGVPHFKCTLPISPFAISPHYNTSCKFVLCASLFFYKETPGYEAVFKRQRQRVLYDYVLCVYIYLFSKTTFKPSRIFLNECYISFLKFCLETQLISEILWFKISVLWITAVACCVPKGSKMLFIYTLMAHKTLNQ